jgi:glycosyltransferase involved in cell wall biosynthesis
MAIPATASDQQRLVQPRQNGTSISIIVPVFNEAANIGPLVARLAPVLDGTGLSWDVLFVNDGSTDETISAIRAEHARDARIKAISFSRNFGKEIAIAAGLDHVAGDAVVIMDADLQHPPETIPAFIAKWRQGYAMVYGERSGRETESAVKRYFAERFYKVFARFGETPLPNGAGDFRLIDRRAVEAMRAMGEKARFSKGIYAWVGFKSCGVAFEVGERLHGQTKFNYPKLFRFAFDGISSFSIVPLKIATYLGVVIAFVAMGLGAYFLFRTLFFGTDLPGFPSLIVSIMFFSGIQLVSLGLIGEYVGRIFAEVKRRPLYLIDERIGAPAAPVERGPGVLPPARHAP